MTLLELTEQEKKKQQAKGNPLSKEKNCLCCGQEFIAKLMVEINEGLGYFPHFCKECQHMIDEVKWFKHHRKNPTPEALHREYRKLFKIVFSRTVYALISNFI